MKISPELLTAARVTEGLTRDQATQKLKEAGIKINPDGLTALETLGRPVEVATETLKIIAKVYRRQLAYFLLEEIPRERRAVDRIVVYYTDGTEEEYKQDNT